jgi:8-oxo-dGTP pyrophosphatase MutT (NUDIX family)
MPALNTFLARYTALIAEDDLWRWDGVPTPLWRTTYLTAEEPPLAAVTSVRAIVFRGEEVLVVREPGGAYYVVPGGRREPGETIEATLRREVVEETGWSLDAIEPLAVTHYRHSGPCPPGYPYPYPDFAQIIFLAEATSFDPDGRIPDEWVAESGFYPAEEALRLVAPRQSERLLLEAALARRRAH